MDPRRKFASFGDLVPSADVPGLVRAGLRVWSFGYGDDPDAFTVIDEGDLWVWDEGRDDVISSWAPFRVDLGEDDE